MFERVFPALVRALADASDEDLPAVREAALIFLYRLLFVLYAEDRGLLPVNDTRYAEYGLRKPVREDIARRMDAGTGFSDTGSSYYGRLETLFELIDGGDASIGLPPYNGGLFAKDAASLLRNVHLSDAAVAPIVYDLSHAETAGGRSFINYRDMSVQQLGSIYERLLEREPVRDDSGRIVVRPNSYARKDSGSFYTPQELVDLIVDRTLKPLAEERLAAFRKKAAELKGDRRPKPEREAELRALDPAEAVLDLKVLDPAMGSGHFLVTAVDFLSDYVAELVEYAPVVPEWLDGEYASPLVDRVAAVRRDILDRARQSDWVIDEAQLTDQAILRRMVLKRCIYGVDKNPLTVELAKVSLWLHSFTVGAPLSFLDHHLRRGDSLVGMRVLEATGELNRLGGLFASSAIAGAEAATTGMQRIEEMSDADVAEVRESASLFREVEATTADLRGLLDFLCGLRWLTAGMKTRERKSFEAPLSDTLGRHPDDAYGLLATGPAAVSDGGAPGGASNSEFERLWSDATSIADQRGLSALGGRVPRRVAPVAGRAARRRLRRRDRQPAVGPDQAPGGRVVRDAEPRTSRWPRLRLPGGLASSGCAPRGRRWRTTSTRRSGGPTGSGSSSAARATTRCWAAATSTSTRCSSSARWTWSSPTASSGCSRRRASTPTRRRRRSSSRSPPSAAFPACSTSKTGRSSSRTYTHRSSSAPSSSAARSGASTRPSARSSCTTSGPSTTRTAASRWPRRTSPA